jgi:hypothetical protein
MTRPILIAGLLGGLLGGVASFAASRWIVPAGTAKPEPGSKIPIPPEALAAAEAYVAKLEAMKYDDFMAEVRLGEPMVPKEDFEAFQQKFKKSRAIYHGTFGNRTEPFELIRETALSRDLVQFAYLEKFDRGMVAWYFILNQTKDGWRLARVWWNEDLSIAFVGGS